MAKGSEAQGEGEVPGHPADPSSRVLYACGVCPYPKLER